MIALSRIARFTFAGIAALILAGGTAGAGGMPADEGPEVVLDAVEPLILPTVAVVVKTPEIPVAATIERVMLPIPLRDSDGKEDPRSR
ncbi:MAG: hypothetical protein IIA73_02645 [Proteobacteria bacterium]|nr:hypothetical protein [Pseudomonadota bacterium]